MSVAEQDLHDMHCLRAGAVVYIAAGFTVETMATRLLTARG